MTNFDKIVNELMLAASNKKHVLFGVGKPFLVQTMKRCYQDLNFSGLNEPRILAVDVPESGIIEVPVDYEELIRISVLDGRNKLVPVYYDARLPIQFEYLRANDNSLILDPTTGLPLKSYTKVEEVDVFEFSECYAYANTCCSHNYRYGGFYGLRGGYYNTGGRFRWEAETRTWHVRDINRDKIFLEYLSDPFMRDDFETIEVSDVFVDALKNKTIYELIKDDMSVPANRIEMARLNAARSVKKAVLRKNIRAEELIQAARTMRGSYKF